MDSFNPNAKLSSVSISFVSIYLFEVGTKIDQSAPYTVNCQLHIVTRWWKRIYCIFYNLPSVFCISFFTFLFYFFFDWIHMDVEKPFPLFSVSPFKIYSHLPSTCAIFSTSTVYFFCRSLRDFKNIVVSFFIPKVINLFYFL